MLEENFEVSEDLYLYPTPAGAYYAVSTPETDPARKLLRSLFQFRSTPRLNCDNLTERTGLNDKEHVAELVERMQNLAWLQGCEEVQYVPSGSLEDVLPELLMPLSEKGNVLLADSLGFHIAHRGFNYEAVEQLSALSAGLATLHERHYGLLRKNLGLNTSAWAVVDVAGNSQVGFWPLYIGEQKFVLVIGGVPHLNQPTLTALVWALSIRYGEEDSL